MPHYEREASLWAACQRFDKSGCLAQLAQHDHSRQKERQLGRQVEEANREARQQGEEEGWQAGGQRPTGLPLQIENQRGTVEQQEDHQDQGAPAALRLEPGGAGCAGVAQRVHGHGGAAGGQQNEQARRQGQQAGGQQRNAREVIVHVILILVPVG